MSVPRERHGVLRTLFTREAAFPEMTTRFCSAGIQIFLLDFGKLVTVERSKAVAGNILDKDLLRHGFLAIETSWPRTGELVF